MDETKSDHESLQNFRNIKQPVIGKPDIFYFLEKRLFLSMCSSRCFLISLRLVDEAKTTVVPLAKMAKFIWERLGMSSMKMRNAIVLWGTPGTSECA